jgi:hypothetical protein
VPSDKGAVCVNMLQVDIGAVLWFHFKSLASSKPYMTRFLVSTENVGVSIKEC